MSKLTRDHAVGRERTAATTASPLASVGGALEEQGAGLVTRGGQHGAARVRLVARRRPRGIVILGAAIALLPWARAVLADPPATRAGEAVHPNGSMLTPSGPFEGIAGFQAAGARGAVDGRESRDAEAGAASVAPTSPLTSALRQSPSWDETSSLEGVTVPFAPALREGATGLGPRSPGSPGSDADPDESPEETSEGDELEGGEWDRDQDGTGLDDDPVSDDPAADAAESGRLTETSSAWEQMDAWSGSGPDALRGLGVAPLLHDPRAKDRGSRDSDPQQSGSEEGVGEGEEEEAALPAKIDLKPRWIKVEVIGGDRLEEIAQRYGVSRSSIIRWNKLDEKKPFIRKGQQLRLKTDRDVAPRERISYPVQKGDTWAKIAERHGVDVDRLHLWNRKVPTRFKVGEKLTVYVEPLPPEDDEIIAAGAKVGGSGGGGLSSGRGSANARAAAIPLAKIRMDSRSTGRPNRGRIVNSVQIPENPKLYTLRNADQSYGSSHAIMHLQAGFAAFRRDYHYAGQVYIGDMSKKGGGKLSPHSSHQSGRDVDIRLPVVAGVKGPAASMSEVDWDAAWALIKAIIDTGEVEYVFLTHERQKQLYAAARRAGESKASLARYMQYPNPAKTNHGIVRHSKGHTVHFHVRFHCGPKESQCDSGR